MNRMLATTKQRFAACLLFVFLFINAAQLLHTHDNVKGCHKSASTQQVTKGADCPVCDYHFTKEAIINFQLITINKPQPDLVVNCVYQNRKASSVGLSYADRGPPSIV